MEREGASGASDLREELERQQAEWEAQKAAWEAEKAALAAQIEQLAEQLAGQAAAEEEEAACKVTAEPDSFKVSLSLKFVLHSLGWPEEAASLGRMVQDATSDLTRSLQACILNRNAERYFRFCEPYNADAQTWQLLAAAGRVGNTGVPAARQLLLLDPKAAVLRHCGWSDGETPAHVAAEAGNAAVFKLLLEAAPEAAGMRCTSFHDDLEVEEKSCTLLHAAALGGNTEIIQLLLAADPGSAEALSKHESSPLHFAAWQGHSEAVQLLLAAAPAMATAVDYDNGYTPLHQAAFGDSPGHAAAVRMLMHAAPEAADIGGEAGLTPVEWAVRQGRMPALEAFLEAAPACVGVDTGGGMLPLHLAAENGQADAVRLLLKAAPDTAAEPDGSGRLPLHFAAAGGSTGVVLLLMAAAPQALLQQDAAGNTPLCLAAASCGNPATVKLLLEAAPEAAHQASGSQRWTPLHAAAQRGNAAAARVLLAAAPQTAQQADAHGRTPLTLAVRSYLPWSGGGHKETIRMLMPLSPASKVFSILADAGPEAAELFADAVIAHALLTAEQWAQVPAPCPGLGRALPAALSQSPEQARQLVSRLPAADAARLKAFLQALGRMQSALPAGLPPDVLRKFLSLCF